MVYLKVGHPRNLKEGDVFTWASSDPEYNRLNKLSLYKVILAPNPEYCDRTVSFISLDDNNFKYHNYYMSPTNDYRLSYALEDTPETRKILIIEKIKELDERHKTRRNKKR